MSLPSNMPGDYTNKRGDKAISKKNLFLNLLENKSDFILSSLKTNACPALSNVTARKNEEGS